MKKIFFRLYNSLIKNPATSQTALISIRDLNIWKALKDKQCHDFMLNRSQEKILIAPSNMGKANILYLPAPTKTLEQIKVSGLKDLPIEYLNGSHVFKEIYKKGFFISMSKLLYIVNLGLSEDPGRNEEFIMFYKERLKEQVEGFVRNMNEEDFAKLHTSEINSENEVILYKTQKGLTNLFPERLDNGFEIKENIYKSLEYITSP